MNREGHTGCAGACDSYSPASTLVLKQSPLLSVGPRASRRLSGRILPIMHPDAAEIDIGEI